ncbi:MAG: c-di-GMP phosphodiesterase, partial [Pseudomonadota bacterium]|nr:c-di-GMP phosphodiesterase [Pseudomonadota bacterium]
LPIFFPLGQAARWLPVGELMRTVGEVWPKDGPQVVLSVRCESLLADLLMVQPAPNVMIEVPKFMAGDPAHRDDILQLAANGNTLLLSGRPNHPLPRELLGAFRYSIIDLADERRLDAGPPPPGVTRSIGFFQEGVTTIEQMEGAFQRGALAVLGWPVDEAVQPRRVGSGGIRPDLQITLDLINQVNNEEPLAQLEATLRRDPSLAFKLMRYINSPVFGLTVEVNSFAQAVMLLGYQRLKRWLSLLLVTAGNDQNLRPVMFAAVRRGLLMEALARDGADADERSEMFICGVFSLLDRMFQKSFDELLTALPVPAGVHAALVHEAGPYFPVLDLVRTLEGGSGFDVRDHVQACDLPMRHVNRALLRSLGSALQMA